MQLLLSGKSIISITMVILGGLICSGCAIARANIADRAQTELIGMSKKYLFTCAGVPDRKTHADDLEFFTYTGGGKNVADNDTADPRYCEATFVLKDGKIQKINYSGHKGGLTKWEQCSFIVKNCLKE